MGGTRSWEAPDLGRRHVPSCSYQIIQTSRTSFLSFYHNLEVDKDCLVTQLCLFCIVTSLKILASYTLLLLLMYSCKFQLRNSIFIILYTITCALNDQSCRCAIKQHSFIPLLTMFSTAIYFLCVKMWHVW